MYVSLPCRVGAESRRRLLLCPLLPLRPCTAIHRTVPRIPLSPQSPAPPRVRRGTMSRTRRAHAGQTPTETGRLLHRDALPHVNRRRRISSMPPALKRTVSEPSTFSSAAWSGWKRNAEVSRSISASKRSARARPSTSLAQDKRGYASRGRWSDWDAEN